MKTSRTRFVVTFLVLAFAFQFISNSLLGPEIRLFPGDGAWYPGTASPVGWKNTLASIIYPAKFMLIEPLSFLGKEPDAPPPILVVAFAAYWSALALLLHYLFSKVAAYRKT